VDLKSDYKQVVVCTNSGKFGIRRGAKIQKYGNFWLKGRFENWKFRIRKKWI
jgi:hypothetical protein